MRREMYINFNGNCGERNQLFSASDAAWPRLNTASLDTFCIIHAHNL